MSEDNLKISNKKGIKINGIIFISGEGNRAEQLSGRQQLHQVVGVGLVLRHQGGRL